MFFTLFHISHNILHLHLLLWLIFLLVTLGDILYRIFESCTAMSNILQVHSLCCSSTWLLTMVDTCVRMVFWGLISASQRSQDGVRLNRSAWKWKSDIKSRHKFKYVISKQYLSIYINQVHCLNPRCVECN